MTDYSTGLLTDHQLAKNCYDAGWEDGQGVNSDETATELLKELRARGKDVTPYNLFELLDDWGFTTPADRNKVVIL